LCQRSFALTVFLLMNRETGDGRPLFKNILFKGVKLVERWFYRPFTEVGDGNRALHMPALSWTKARFAAVKT
jgi:hypothetical protein